MFNRDALKELFPEERTDRFFGSLFGDPSEGAFDISLEFEGRKGNRLHFQFHLKQKPGKCFACNLTYGLPQVFSRHPVIDVEGLVKRIDRLLGEQAACHGWEMGDTREVSRNLHVIPFTVTLE